MFLSDVAVKRPVVATVLSLVLTVCGLVAFEQLPLRQYPDIDPPVVSITTVYPGASANIVETRVTELIEERISGVEGIDTVQSVSRDGSSGVTITFLTSRDIDAAANDVRDRVAGILDDLPPEAESPDIGKQDADQDVMLWLNLISDRMTVPELTDYARRYLTDRFSVLPGVARIRIGGQQNFAMRIWLDRRQMTARGITSQDIEAKLRGNNLELPAGTLESSTRQFTVRLDRSFKAANDFNNLVLAEGDDGYLVRLSDVARVEFGTEEYRSAFRGNGVPQVGLGIIRQSTANTLDVARGAKALGEKISATLPEGMEITLSYDTSVFIEGAINEVYKTLAIAIGLVIVVIFIFLGSARSVLVPAVAVPVSIIGTCLAIWALGFTINLLTLLALVLVIGLVVDDAIVVLENIVRRMKEYGETPLVAAYEGTRQVSFAVIATTIVLIAVFVPVAFLQSDVGRLFSEFALTIAAAVAISSFVALTLSPVIASKFLRSSSGSSGLVRWLDKGMGFLTAGYSKVLRVVLATPLIGVVLIAGSMGGAYGLHQQLPTEFAPREDRGAFFVFVRGPEGASYEYMTQYMEEIERRLMPYADSGVFQRLLIRAPLSRGGNAESFNSGIVIVVLDDWAKRKPAWPIMNEVRGKLASLSGVRAFPVMRQGFGGRTTKPIQMTIGGGSWEQLVEWRRTLTDAIEDRGLALTGIDWDYKETRPELRVEVDYDRAAELGVSINGIGRTLETMLGSRRVTSYLLDGEEYDVILEGERDAQRTPNNLQNIYVRSDTTQTLVPLSNLVSLTEKGGSGALNRFNRIRAITLEANLPDGQVLGESLAELEALAREVLPEEVVIDFKGQSRDLRESSDSILFVFAFGVMVVFLVLAAQFESWRHPFVIMLSVPAALAGGLASLWIAGASLNLYSQIGLIMLVGLAAKNGILIVEFANQLRDAGKPFMEALHEAALVRFRPILMTGITTAAGAVPLLLSSGPGSETRMVIGLVVLGGVVTSTIVTLITVPAAYALIAKGSASPGAVAEQLAREQARAAAAQPGD